MREHLAALVDAGAVPEALVDAAVRRVLRLKLRLGLFEHPYVDEALAGQLILREDFRALALQVAQESMVLLKNAGGLLPLAPGGRRIALIGPLADTGAGSAGLLGLPRAGRGRRERARWPRAYAAGEQAPAYVPGCAVKGDQGPVDIAGGGGGAAGCRRGGAGGGRERGHERRGALARAPGLARPPAGAGGRGRRDRQADRRWC